MFRSFVPDNRRFVPTNLIWILLLGVAAFLMLNQTLTFSVVSVANWVIMGSCILLSLALSVYFLVSLMLYCQDHGVSRAVMLIIGLVVLLFIGLNFFRICQNLSEASWEMEPWDTVRLRYSHPHQSLEELLAEQRQLQLRRINQDDPPPKDTKSLWIALGFLVLCLVCNAIYRPYRLKMAQEKGYNTESTLNLLTGVAMLLLLVAGIAKPVCLLWLGGLALVLFLLRLPKLGLVHALLITLLQPLAMVDMGVSRMKYNTTISPAPRMGIGIFVNTANFVGLNMARKEEIQEELQEDKQVREALNKNKKK